MKPRNFFNKLLPLTLVGFLFGIISTAFAIDNNFLIFGTWSSACAADGSGNFNIEMFKFANHSAIYSIKTFADKHCKKLVSTLITYRSFKLDGPVTTLPNTRKLDYQFKSVTMTYNDPAAVVAANKSPGYYGYTNWILNRPKEVTNLKRTSNSNPEHAKGEKFFTIVKIENNKLYMGDYASGAGTSDKTRLSALYKTPFIK